MQAKHKQEFDGGSSRDGQWALSTPQSAKAMLLLWTGGQGGAVLLREGLT